MATSLWNLLNNYKIVIPLLQRDYAQGRLTGKVPTIRERFLNEILSAVLKSNSEALELDFVYGYTKENENGYTGVTRSFIPLDGQQRLTTLFLLHWFIAVKENKMQEAEELLSKFTYETRYSSRIFCQELVKFIPNDLERPLEDTIVDQNWFFTAWRHDPTIKSMLTMLNAIQDKFGSIDNMWQLLTGEQSRIVFHLLPMEKLGLPDDLYIKMNSRGKELTEFEYFKSRFSEILSPKHSIIFNNKVDQEWSDLFWDLYKDDEVIDIAKKVDDSFLRFFRYITDLLCHKLEIANENQDDEFVIIKGIYSNEECVTFLFSCLDLFTSLNKTHPNFFVSTFYITYDDFNDLKTRLFFQNPSIDLFKKCAERYQVSDKPNPFSIGEQLLLYACIVHLTEGTSDFNDRIRTVRNLISNSGDEVRKENMTFLLSTVLGIITDNYIDDTSRFNKTQANEEISKQAFILANSILKETIYRLEDHNLLQGCIAILKLEDKLDIYAKEFEEIYQPSCDYDTISRALLTFGDYTQDWGKLFTQFGVNDNTWRELFTPSAFKKGFEKTQSILYLFFDYRIQNPNSQLDLIISNYLNSFSTNVNNPKDWRYYYIKYPEFRKNEYGYYYWPKDEFPYECMMMRRSNLRGFYWSPYLLYFKNKYGSYVNLDDYGAPLLLVKGNSTLKVTNINSGFHFEAVDDDGHLLLERIRKLKYLESGDVFRTSQNEDGIDIEDRIEKGSEMISKIIAL